MKEGQREESGRKREAETSDSHHTIFSDRTPVPDTKKVQGGPFLVLFSGRIYKAAEMLILCCLHDNRGFIQ